MNVLVRAALTAALVAPVVAAPASAQRYKVDFGLNGGYSWYSAMLGSDELGAEDADVRFNPNWLLGSQLTFWATPKIGIRANMTYTDTDLVIDDGGTGEEIVSNEHINLWSGTGDLLFRFREPNEEWMGMETLPYLALGLGGKWHNPAGDFVTCTDNEEGESQACHPFGVNGNGFALMEQKTLAGLIGLGADFRMSPNMAIRLEVNDRIYKPKLYEADFVSTTAWNLPNGDDNVSKVVHEIGAQIGLHILAGLAAPPVVAVRPAPPEPAPTPPPTPAPPREDAITVCVIDPTVPAGYRMQTATFLHASGDTVVTLNGQRVPLDRAVGTVVVAGGQDWYVSGAPLTVTVGNDSYEYLTYQGARQIDANRLTFLGTVNGLPVYADRDQVADVREQLEEVREARGENDLEDILEQEEDLREAIDAVQIVYAPLQPTGCVFQALQRQQQVRKGK